MQAGTSVLAEIGKTGREAPIAVIDIGSNSIRLVIYASGGRYPFPLFNERSNCRLGEGLGEDDMLQPDRIQVALAALSRFAQIMSAMGVTTIHDPSNSAAEIFPAASYQRVGKYLAPRIFSTGEVVYGAKAAGIFAEIDSLADARAYLERASRQWDEAIARLRIFVADRPD